MWASHRAIYATTFKSVEYFHRFNYFTNSIWKLGINSSSLCEYCLVYKFVLKIPKYIQVVSMKCSELHGSNTLQSNVAQFCAAYNSTQHVNWIPKCKIKRTIEFKLYKIFVQNFYLPIFSESLKSIHLTLCVKKQQPQFKRSLQAIKWSNWS